MLLTFCKNIQFRLLTNRLRIEGNGALVVLVATVSQILDQLACI
jgi:hypothetical protein